MKASEPITEYDLQAYVDGLLPNSRCRQVERHLATHPAIAAQVMADMANGRALRDLAADSLEPPGAALVAAAESLDRTLARQPVGRGRRGLAVAAACLLAVTAAVATHLARPTTPGFVDEALMSRQTAFLRANMASQPEARSLDRQEISRATQIVLPVLPATWRLTDVQVFPSDDGPSVGIIFESPELGAASLFAVRDAGKDEIEPTTIRRLDGVVTYWRRDGMSYALIARAGLDKVSSSARRLAASEPAAERL